MSTRTRTPVRHRTLWISDVHLGSPGSKAKLLVEFLKRNDCEQLYLVGDIFDGWKMRSRFYWTPDHSRVIKAIIAKARHGTKVYYLAGNHDEFMRQFVKNQLRLGRVRLADEVVHTTADGRRLLVMHGDRLDEVVTGFPWLAYAGDAAYEVLMWSNTWVNRVRHRAGLPYWSLSNFAKTHVKAAVQFLSGFDQKIVYRCERENLKGVICGHTHHAEVREVDHGITSYNCGDWVESCTALAEDANGHIRILHGATPEVVAAASADAAIGEQKPRVWLPLRPLMELRVRRAGASRRNKPGTVRTNGARPPQATP